VCYWLITPQTGAAGASFFGNATGITNTSSDQDATDYIVPTFTFASGGGQDVITFAEYGTYILIFNISVNYPATSISSVDISSSVTLVGCDCLGSTYNSGSLGLDNSVFCLGTFHSLFGGTITFPDYTSLLALYGSSWDHSFCTNVAIVRLS